MSSANPGRLVYAQFARLARTLGHEHRLELIELLAQRERSVEQLADATGLAFANVSQHLQQLRKAGLVTGRRDGKNVVYRLGNGPIVEAVSALQRLAQANLADIDVLMRSHFHPLDGLEPISAADLLARLDGDSVTLLDVRPIGEYAHGHLPRALNVPLDRLEASLADLPRDRTIVAYCRGPFCVLAYEAVRLLRARGFDAYRLEGGWPEWKAKGLPVA